MPKITFVKKILTSGEQCAKCADVEAKLKKDGYIAHIDQIVVADERDSNSPGMQLARKFNITLAPFFIVEDQFETRTYTVYFQFLKEEFKNPRSDPNTEAVDVLRANPDLDFL